MRDLFRLGQTFEKEPKKALFIVFSAAFLVCLLGLIVNIPQISKRKSFLAVPGHVENLEVEHKLRKWGSQSRYTYDLVWEVDEQVYQKRVTDAISKPNKNLSVVYVNPNDPMDVDTSEYSSFVKDNILFTIVFVISGIGLVVLWLTRKKK